MPPKRQRIAKKKVEMSESEKTVDGTLYPVEYLVKKRKIGNQVIS